MYFAFLQFKQVDLTYDYLELSLCPGSKGNIEMSEEHLHVHVERRKGQ